MKSDAWSWKPIGELFEIGAGKTMSAAARDGAHQVPFLRTSNVFWDRIDLSVVDTMAIGEHELPAKLVRPGDLLVCEGGDIGRAALWSGERDVMSFQNHLHRLRPVSTDVHPKFYVYFLQCAFTQLGIFEGAGNRTTIPNLSRNRLAELEVPVPPIEEQEGIARCLAEIREAIDVQDRALVLVNELKATTMRELFTRGLRGEAQKETEIGLVPESWRVVRISQILSIKHGFAFLGDSFRPDGMHILLTPGHFFESGGFRDQGEKTKFVCGPIPKSSVLRQGDLLVAMTEQKAGLLGSTIRIPLSGMYLHNQRLGLVENVANSVFPEFLYHLLNHELVRSEVARTATGSKVRHTSPRRIGEIVVAIPAKVEQREIATILDTIDRKIDLHKRKRAVLESLFKSLLHKLMTGEIRVADLNLSALESRADTVAAA